MNRRRFRTSAFGWTLACMSLILLAGSTGEPAFARLPPPLQDGDAQGGEGTPYEEPELNSTQYGGPDETEGSATLAPEPGTRSGVPSTSAESNPPTSAIRSASGPGWWTRIIRFAAAWWWLFAGTPR